MFATPKNALGSMHVLELRDRGLDLLTPGGAGDLLRTQTVALLRTGIRRMTRTRIGAGSEAQRPDAARNQANTMKERTRHTLQP